MRNVKCVYFVRPVQLVGAPLAFIGPEMKLYTMTEGDAGIEVRFKDPRTEVSRVHVVPYFGVVSYELLAP